MSDRVGLIRALNPTLGLMFDGFGQACSRLAIYRKMRKNSLSAQFSVERYIVLIHLTSKSFSSSSRFHHQVVLIIKSFSSSSRSHHQVVLIIKSFSSSNRSHHQIVFIKSFSSSRSHHQAVFIIKLYYQAIVASQSIKSIYQVILLSHSIKS
jgi:capsule polysaccharide export protein KpsE/RkpR